jgi:hypothetical protein
MSTSKIPTKNSRNNSINAKSTLLAGADIKFNDTDNTKAKSKNDDEKTYISVLNKSTTPKAIAAKSPTPISTLRTTHTPPKEYAQIVKCGKEILSMSDEISLSPTAKTGMYMFTYICM